MQNGRFPCKIELHLRKVCYKVSLCEYCELLTIFCNKYHITFLQHAEWFTVQLQSRYFSFYAGKVL